MTATYFSIYSEPALINVLAPTLALLVWYFFKNKPNFFSMVKNVGFIYVLVFILSPFAIYSVFVNTLTNIKLLMVPCLNGIAPMSAVSVAQRSVGGFYMQTWEVAGAILGFMSYYNTGSFHNTMRFLFMNHPVVAFIGFILFSGCGLLGCLKTNNILARLFSIPLISWILVAFVAANQHDDFRFARSLHYAMPFAMIGVVLLASQYWRKRDVIFTTIKRNLLLMLVVSPRNRRISLANIGRNSIKYLAIVVLGIFIFMNTYTTARTIRFIASHNNENDHEKGNDPVLLRFDERSLEWRLLKKELRYSSSRQVPVLISGFQETVRPLAISIIMRNQKHVLGYDVLHLWRLYDATEPVAKFVTLSEASKNSIETIHTLGTKLLNSLNEVFRPYQNIAFNVLRIYSHILTYQLSSDYLEWAQYNTRFKASEMLPFQHNANKPWYKLEADLVSHSEQAVVSFNNNYPQEWLSQKDIFPPLVKNFPNICRVIYRHKYAVTLPKRMISPLAHDRKGAFRKLSSSGPIIIHDKATIPQVLTLDYDGKVGDVKLHVGNKLYVGKKIHSDTHMEIAAVVHPCDNSSLSLDVAGVVKIRSMSWVPAIG